MDEESFLGLLALIVALVVIGILLEITGVTNIW